ncbi:MAG: hypothetical protein ACK5MT_21090 [Actinomycetales bacterium]
MTRTTTGLIVGLALGLGAAMGGFWGFLITAVLGSVGLAAGAYLDGYVDLSQLANRRGRPRDPDGGWRG